MIFLKRKNIAHQMFNEEVDGKPRYTIEEIYKKTGWLFDNYDAKWKGEYIDNPSVNKINNWLYKQNGLKFDLDNKNSILYDSRFLNTMNFQTFGDILDNNSVLLSMYPQLKNIKIIPIEGVGSNGAAGSTFNSRNGTKLSNPLAVAFVQNEKPNIPFENNVSISNIAHEIQHVIQAIEGYEYGDKTKTEYSKLHGEIDAYNEGFKQALGLNYTNVDGIFTNEEIKNEEIFGENERYDSANEPFTSANNEKSNEGISKENKREGKKTILNQQLSNQRKWRNI